MGFWRNLFSRRKTEEEFEEEWDQVVFARDGVDFTDEEQRSRYIAGCLEQIAEAQREIDLLTGEYNLVTSYLMDTEELEALPDAEKEKIESFAMRLQTVERERRRYNSKKDRMRDSEFHRMRCQEEEIAEGIEKLREAEEYAALVKQDLRRLDGERHAYAFRRNELLVIQANMRGLAVIFLAALVVCVLLLAILQFGFGMETRFGYFLSVVAAGIAITVVFVKNLDAGKEIERIDMAVNKLIQLQNKVKIRYVNNRNLLDYLYMKYDAESAEKLAKRWKIYQQEKEERKEYAEAEAKADYYGQELTKLLANYRVRNPRRFLERSGALIDRREMVEMRHELILRRQALRKQLDYNTQIGESARSEVKDVAEQYPQYAGEILEMVDKFEKTRL